MIQDIYEVVRLAESNYLQGKTKLGDYVERSQHEVIQRIDAYSNSKHTTGDKDSLDRDKPFFNIVTAAINIWYRATDIDRKDIRLKATKASQYVLSFVSNILLQAWMRKTGFGQFLNEWG